MARERELLNHPMALARIIELAAGTVSTAHYHSNVHEYIVCLDGDSGATFGRCDVFDEPYGFAPIVI